MKILNGVALAGVIALGVTSTAYAQETSPAPSVPNLANPYPLNPVASDGTPLPRYNGVTGLYSGRSAYAPYGVVGDGLAGGAVDTGLGIANDALGTGLGATDDVLR